MDIGLPLYRCEDVRAIDAFAIARDGIPAFELMTRAAEAAFDLLRASWPDAHRIAVVCGPGNNGGDGYVLARLARAAGRDVRVIALASSPGNSPEAQRAQAEWRAAGGEVDNFEATHAFPDCDVLVDALYGIGLTRAPTGAAVQAIDAINATNTPILALDVPSGLDADRGQAPGVAVRATRTVCFIAAKRGLYTGRARELCGVVTLESLGVMDGTLSVRKPVARLLTPDLLVHWLRPRARDAHKGNHGHLLAVGGDHGYAGAIRLCAEAALRCGAGLVSVATRAENVAGLVASRPEAMVRAVEDATALRTQFARSDVIALGPGLGQGEWGRALFDASMTAGLPCVIDADALNLLAQDGRPLPDAILTPHPGEAARLLDTDIAAIEADRFVSAQALADRYAAVIVLKGAGTIVAAPGRVPAVIGAGNPGMASAGMGDVLTGVIAAFSAQGLSAFDAACAGALLHAAAGDAAASAGGERGLLASDLFPALRRLANPA